MSADRTQFAIFLVTLCIMLMAVLLIAQHV